MARPSKLTEKQWIEITDRIARGEGVRSLAKEFKIAESSIREKVSDTARKIKAVANQMVATEVNLKALPISAQISAHNLADQLKQMSMHLTCAATNGAAIANRLSGMAAKHTDLIDDTDLASEESMDAVKTVNAIMRTANESSALARDLVKANKEAMDSSPPDQNKPEFDLSHIPASDLEAIKAKLYARPTK